MSGRFTPLAAALTAAGVVTAGQAVLDRLRPDALAAWRTTNFRGGPVTLAAGPLVAAGSVVGTAAAAAAAGGSAVAGPSAAVLAAGSVLAGRYDDVVGARPEQLRDKGFHGHVAALRAGRLSSGTVKVLGIGGTALAVALSRAGGRQAGRRRLDPVLDALLLASTANLVNLLDLRPGRALKVVALAAGGEVLGLTAPDARRSAAGLAGAALAALPADLDERTMLGDAGANAAGALLALPLVVGAPRGVRATVLAGVLALTAASERVSFSAVIDRTPPLAWLDRLGRRSAPGSAG